MPSIDACVFSIFLYWFHCGIHCGAVRQVHQAITWYNFHVDHVVQHIVQRMLRFGQPWAAILFFSLGQGLHHQPGHMPQGATWVMVMEQDTTGPPGGFNFPRLAPW